MQTAFKTKSYIRWISNDVINILNLYPEETILYTDFEKVDTKPFTTSNLTKLVPYDKRLSLLSLSSKQIESGNGSHIQVEGEHSIHAYTYTKTDSTVFLDILSIYTDILGKDYVQVGTIGNGISGNSYIVFSLVFDNQEIFDKFVYATTIIKMRFDEVDLQSYTFKISDIYVDVVLERLHKY